MGGRYGIFLNEFAETKELHEVFARRVKLGLLTSTDLSNVTSSSVLAIHSA